MASPSLILSNNNAFAPLTLDLSQYLDLTPDGGLDPQNPAFSTRVISHSLLREGGVLALEDFVNKELVFPVKLNAATSSGLIQLIAEINQIVTAPGATFSWQDTGLSQPTVFDGISGQLDIKYNYRETSSPAHWCTGELRLFTMPFGHAGAPRPYAAASGVGPLLMISPYASGGALTIGASTQAGVAGFGGAPMGASSGVFYWGAPSLAGDAPALLQVSYVGPLAPGATNTGVTPTAAVSLLPDALYNPLVTAPQISVQNVFNLTTLVSAQTSVASQYLHMQAFTFAGGASGADVYNFQPLPQADISLEPTVRWTGQHRVLAVARASAVTGNAGGGLALAGPLITRGAQAVPVTSNVDWGLYDLGTYALRASEFPEQIVQVIPTLASGSNAALDVAALITLPDSTTWFMNPTQIQASQYGYPTSLASAWGAPGAQWTNTLLLDDVLSDQFLYSGQSQTWAPSPIGAVPSSARITQSTRGLVPRPDPRNGLPVIAIVGVGQAIDPSSSWSVPGVGALVGTRRFPGASQANPQNLRTMAQVAVFERTRYVLP